jgi:nitroimidazol reductase NimA-like FMN-containing flavoprotein (pyridoxamine 5'-phosphate oxidase superfamily)
MAPDDSRVREFLRRSMNMRVATLSTSEVPHITPLRFIYDRRSIYALTRTVTLVARHIRDRPDVVLLFDAERRTGPVLRVRRTRPREATPS